MKVMALLVAILALAAGCGSSHTSSVASSSGCTAAQKSAAIARYNEIDSKMISIAGNFTVDQIMKPAKAKREHAELVGTIQTGIAAARAAVPCVGRAWAREHLLADAQIWQEYPTFTSLYKGAAAGM